MQIAVFWDTGMAKDREAMIPVERIGKCILLIRNQKVILDKDLAFLYGIETRDLNKAVSRNLDRFPEDFMFRLSADEFTHLKFHFGTSSWGGTRKRPRAFTEQGIAMLSSVLRSKRAVNINIAIMRTFVRLREILADNAALRRRIEKHDEQIKYIFKILGQMSALGQPKKSDRRFGFHSKKTEK